MSNVSLSGVKEIIADSVSLIEVLLGLDPVSNFQRFVRIGIRLVVSVGCVRPVTASAADSNCP